MRLSLPHLKPGNILFDQEGEAYLSDFGIAKLADTTAAYTGSALIGTPAYMSPEQARGEANVDGRSDVYSLGVILFEMLAGRPPFAADTPMGIAMRHLTDPIPRIRQLKPRLPKQIDRVIRRALAKAPGDRYQSAAGLAEALDEWEVRTPAGATPWAPPVQSDTLSGRAGSIESTGALAEITKSPEPAELLARGERSPKPRRARRMPRTVLVAGLVLGFLLVGAAFAAGVIGGVTHTPTPSPGQSETGVPTQQATVVVTLTPRPTDVATPTASTTTTGAPTFVLRPSSTEVPGAAPPSSTPPPTLPPTDTPVPPATDTEVPTPACTPPEIICEPS